MLVQLKSGNHKYRVPSSAPVMSNRKSESHHKSDPPSIPRRCATSRENLASTSSGLKRRQGHDLSESNANEERTRKKHKVTMEAEKSQVHKDSAVFKKKRLTGRSFKSKFKSPKEATVPEKMATDKSENLMNPKGVEEGAHLAFSTKKRCLTKKYEQCSEDRNDSERDVLLDEDEDIDKEKSIVDEGRSPVVSSSLNNVKDTIEENSANKEHFGDQDRPPSQKKLAVEGKSSESDPIILLRKLKKSCDKRWNTLIEKHKKECQEIEQVCKDDISKLENDKKLRATIIRAIYGKSSTAVDKLYLLDVAFAKNMEEITLQKDMKLKDIETRHQAERNKEKQKVADWLSDAEAYVPSKHSDCCKSQSELRAHTVGAKDVKPLIQHGENTDSSTVVQGKHIVQSNNYECATAERLACILTNGIPSSASNSIKKGGIAVTDTLISAVVEQMNQPKHLHTAVSTCAKLPVSGERGPDEMQSHELHEDIPSELHETVANEIVDNANPVNMNTNTPITIIGFGGGNAIKLSHTENFSTGEIITEESVPGDVQSFELVDVPADLPETVASEIVDDVNPVDLSTRTIEGSGEGDAIDLPEAEQLTKPKHFGSAERILANPHPSGGRVNSELQLLELHKYIPAESAETVDVGFVDNVNPVELSASTEGFGKEGTSHLPDAFLNQKNETHGTNIEDLDLVGQVLQTSDQTKAFQHPSTLLPLRIQEDEDAASAELQDHAVEMVGKAVSSLSKVITPEVVDTATNSLSNIQPQSPMETELKTRSSSRTAISTSKILDTVILEQSSMKLQDQETTVVKDQVTSVIELVDLERVDSAAPVATSEFVGTAKSLQSDNGLQDQVEHAIKTQRTPWVEVAFSENQNHTLPVLSSTEHQDEDTLIVENQLSLEIEVSNLGVADNATPLQSRIDTPPIGSDEQLQFMPIEAFSSCNQLPPPEPELEMLSHICTAQLIEDLQQLNCVGAETQSFQNNVAAEGLLSTTGIPHRQLGDTSRLPSHEVVAWISPFMLLDPFQAELEKISKGIDELKKSHEDTVSVLKSDYVKEIEELTAKIKNKYKLKYEDAQAQFGQKSNELNQNLKKLLMNKKLADAFKLKGSPSNLEQYHQHLVRPAGATPFNPQITGQNGQGMQQMLVPPSTILGPFTSHPFPSQSYAAPPVQAVAAQAQHVASVYRQFRAINGVHPASNTHIPRSGENIPSSPCIQSFIPPAAPSIPTAALLSAFQNILQPQPQPQPQTPQQQQQQLQLQQLQQQLQLQQQQQRQLQLQQHYLATQWPLSTQNPRHLGYPSSLSHAYQSTLGLQQHHNQLPSFVQGGNQRSCGGSTIAINLCDDD